MPSLDFDTFIKRLKKAKVVAVVGATVNVEKYGYKIMHELLETGYIVVPVTPKYEQVLGVKAVAKLQDINRPLDVVVFVVPPHVTGKIIRKLPAEARKWLIWLQPGSYTIRETTLLEQKGFDYVAGFCILKDFLLQLKNTN